jgi:hypothetical protein
MFIVIVENIILLNAVRRHCEDRKTAVGFGPCHLLAMSWGGPELGFHSFFDAIVIFDALE